MSREADYITEARAHVRNVWNSLHALKNMQDEWNAQDYGNTLDDGAGDNLGITKTDVGAAVFATTDALVAVAFASGHATNLSNLL